jgi:hypothetical protein
MKPMDMEGRATFLPFKDTLPGSVMNQRELALPGLLAGAVNAFTAPSRVSTQGFDAPEEALNLATNVFGGGITTGKMMRNPTGVGGTDLALNVYHGTPNEIQGKFDLSKIGSGEGNQAYGHGIYFAENPAVAKMYQDQLAYKAFDLKPEARAMGIELSAGARGEFYRQARANKDPNVAAGWLQAAKIDTREIPKEKLSELFSKYYERGQGNLYKADIPDQQIPMMINWDKPINEQTPEVMAALKGIDKLLPEIPNFNMGKWMEAGPLASTWHNAIAKDLKLPPEEIAKLLQSKGITGIKYLDELSRTSGKGTSNFVVFKPETVNILERNGVPTRKELLQQEFNKLGK